MKRGEFPFYLVIILIGLWFAGTDEEDDIRTPRMAPPGQAAEAEIIPNIPARPDPFGRGPRFVVEDTGAQQDSTGTAFAIDDDGLWLTARHVVSGCDALGFAVPGQFRTQRAGQAWIHPHSDMALVQGPKPVAAFELASAPAGRGADAFHIGYPQGRPGDVQSQVIGPVRMITRGRHRSDEPAIAYAEVRRHPSFAGSLGGMSGGPIFNERGQVIGVTVAGNPRRGRIIGTAPRSSADLFEQVKAQPTVARPAAPQIDPNSLPDVGDALRRSAAVSRLHCYVN